VPGNLGASIRQLSCSSIDGGLGSRSSSRGGSPIASPRTSMASGLMSTSPHPRRSMDFMSTDPRAMRPSHGVLLTPSLCVHPRTHEPSRVEFPSGGSRNHPSPSRLLYPQYEAHLGFFMDSGKRLSQHEYQVVVTELWIIDVQ
jgi:hypothetical protein